MKVILEPTVTLVGKSTFIPHPTYTIPDDGTDADKLCAFGAKGCYDSYGATGRSNVENQIAVMESEHGSVLEHYHISFFIEGISRGLSLELNRHRPFNISQRSTRYTKEEDSAIVLDPFYAGLFKKYNTKLLEKWYDVNVQRFGNGYGERGKSVQCVDTPLLNIFVGDFCMGWGLGHYTRLHEHFTADPVEAAEIKLIVNFLAYNDLIIHEYASQVETLIKLNPYKLTGFDLRKWARGKARNLLPHGLETRGTWTNNIRGLRWFIEVRSERHAEPEIRVLADKIFRQCVELAPTHFDDFTNVGDVQGIPEWKPKYSKV